MKLLKNKSGREINMLAVILLVLLGVVLYNSGFFGGGAAPAASSTSTGGSAAVAPVAANTVQIVGAPCTQATTLTSSVVRRYTEVAQTGENITIIQNGVLRGTIAHGSTTTVQSGANGDALDLYPALQSTTFYPVHLSGKLNTCTGAATTGDSSFQLVKNDIGMLPGVTPLNPSDTPNHVYQIDTNGNSNWFSIVNDGQASQNTGGQGEGTGSNLTIGSGGSGSVTITFRPGFNAALGPVGGNVLACQFPQAVYDSANPLSVTYQGNLLSASPINPSTTQYPLTGSNYTVKSFVLPPVDGRATTTALMNIVIRADSNHNPQGAVDRINCTIFPTTYYQRQSDGKYVLDIENRDTNSQIPLGVAKPAFNIGIA